MKNYAFIVMMPDLDPENLPRESCNGNKDISVRCKP